MSQKDKAIAKVRAEMAANNGNTYVQAVGNLLILHLEEHPDYADHVLQDSKTILKSLDAMRRVAEKKKVGNCAVLTDAEGFAVVLDYFKSAEPQAPTQTDSKKPTEPVEKKPPSRRKKSEPEPAPEEDDDLDFDSLLM